MIHRMPHLRDDRLFDCYVAARTGEPLDPPTAEHLADCPACAERYAGLAHMMDTVRLDADAAADAVFTPERLTAQQQQIARRLEHVGRAARVIDFPGHSAQRAMGRSHSQAMPPWLVAAAAAVFAIVALGAGYEWGTHVRTAPHPSTYADSSAPAMARAVVPSRQPRPAPVPTLGSAPSDVAADDAFLSDLEAVADRPRTRELRAFETFTPHVRDISDVR